MTLPTLNKDGLLQKYGTDRATTNYAGEYRFDGPRHLIEVVIPDMTKLTATDGAVLLSDQVFVPKSCRIEQVDVVTETAATGSGAVMNVGLIKTDLATEIDYNGLVAALPQTSMTPAGKTTQLRYGDTYAGALIGTTTAYVGMLVGDYDTAAFTAGKVIVRIYYHAV